MEELTNSNNKEDEILRVKDRHYIHIYHRLVCSALSYGHSVLIHLLTTPGIR